MHNGRDERAKDGSDHALRLSLSQDPPAAGLVGPPLPLEAEGKPADPLLGMAIDAESLAREIKEGRGGDLESMLARLRASAAA